MAQFSEASKKELATCHPVLQLLANEAIKTIDFTILEGMRDKEQQDKDFAEGKTKLQWPNGKHNKSPSLAFDVAPYPVDWDNRLHSAGRFYYLAGVMFRVFYELKAQLKIPDEIDLRWGGDWNGDKIFTDQKFDDLGHYEIIQREAA